MPCYYKDKTCLIISLIDLMKFKIWRLRRGLVDLAPALKLKDVCMEVRETGIGPHSETYFRFISA